jgi:hypothetical protein
VPEAPHDNERIAGLRAEDGILPDYDCKNNEAGRHNPAAGLNNWPLTATIDKG